MSDDPTNQLVPAFAPSDGSTDALVEAVIESVNHLIGSVNLLAEVTAALDERVSALEEPETPTRVPFPKWVEWLRSSYNLGPRITEDWQQHPGTTQELAALHAAWLAAFKADGTPRLSAAAANWHDALARVLGRLQERWGKNDTAAIPPLPGQDHYPPGEGSEHAEPSEDL